MRRPFAPFTCSLRRQRAMVLRFLIAKLVLHNYYTFSRCDFYMGSPDLLRRAFLPPKADHISCALPEDGLSDLPQEDMHPISRQRIYILSLAKRYASYPSPEDIHPVFAKTQKKTWSMAARQDCVTAPNQAGKRHKPCLVSSDSCKGSLSGLFF